MNRVFISYSRRNKKFAERLARDLSDAGLDVWIDFRQIHGGELWQEEIYRGISRSDFLVACLSPDAVKSEWCVREIETARTENKLIIPIMLLDALKDLENSEALQWLLKVHFVNFENRYEEAFPELLEALPGSRPIGSFDISQSDSLPNPFKGLEAFQQTDAHFFFGREDLVRKSMQRLGKTRFLAVVGASGSGKSSLVRAGVIPQLRDGKLPGSDRWPIIIFKPGHSPAEALATRLLPLLPGRESTERLSSVGKTLGSNGGLHRLAEEALANLPEEARLVMVIDQFEECFTLANDMERESFLRLLREAVRVEGGRIIVIITMRADFFGHLSRYPDTAELFEQDNLVIATEMTTASLLRSIQGPAEAIGLSYEEGLVDRILSDVQSQPGSLPLLQHALRLLFEKREGARLTLAAYDSIGGVRRALARHAEQIYDGLKLDQQELMEKVMLRLIEISDTGEATRRRVKRTDLVFKNIPDSEVQAILDLLTAQDARLLIASREINTSQDQQGEQSIILEVSHEALIREWDRFKSWVQSNLEDLTYNSEILKLAQDWAASGRDASYLLRGKRLPRAEVWLEGADAIPLQREFIQVSVAERDRSNEEEKKRAEYELNLERQNANRLRIIAVVLVVSLIIAIILTVDSINSRRRAEAGEVALGTQASIAEQNGFDLATQAAIASTQSAISARSAAEAQSLALASGAGQSLSDNQHDLAVVLAVEANQITNPPPAAQRVLADVGYAQGTRRRLETEFEAVNAIAYTPDGRFVIVGAQTGKMSRIDAESGESIVNYIGHSSEVTRILFSPDGRSLFSSGGDGQIIMWNTENGDIIRLFEGHRSGVESLDISLDGLKLVSVDRDSRALVWDVSNGAILQDFVSATTQIQAAVFSQESDKVLLAENNTLNMYNLRSGALERALPQDRFENLARLATNADRTILAAVADSTTLILIDISSGREISQLTISDTPITRLMFIENPDRIVAASADGRLRVWEIDSGLLQLTLEADASIEDLSLSPDALQIAGAVANGTLRIWDLTRAEETQRFLGQGRFVGSVAYHPNNQIIFSASGNLVWVWDINSRFAFMQLEGHTDRVNDIALNNDGSRAITASTDGTLRLWDTATGKTLRAMNGEGSSIQAVAFSPTQDRALSGNLAGSVVLWNTITGRRISVLEGHTETVLALDFSPDGKQALSGSLDGRVILWDVESGEIIRALEGHTGGIRTVAFSPDGALALSGSSDRTIRLWNLADGEEINRYEGHTGAVSAVSFTPDGTLLVSSSFDGTIRLWDMESGFELRRYQAEHVSGGTVRMMDAVISPNGRWVLSGMDDNSVRLWLLLPTVGELLEWVHSNRYVRELDCTERRRFNIDPQCVTLSDVLPTRTPFPVSSATPVLEDPRALTLGEKSVVNPTVAGLIRVREAAGTDSQILKTVSAGDVVTLLEGPVEADGSFWWKIRLDDATEGWMAGIISGLQVLLPWDEPAD